MFYLNGATVSLPSGPSFLLTSVEATILRTLMQQPGVMFTHKKLNTCIYGADEAKWPQSNVLEVLMSRLRRKFRAHGMEDAFYTIRGRGYCLAPHVRVTK